MLIDATLAGPGLWRGLGAAGDPVPEPRRRPALRPGPAAVRLDRGRRVGAAGARPRAQPAGGDGRGAARHGAGARGQGRRQPDGDDPRGRRGPALRRRRRASRGRSTTRCSKRSPRALRTPDLGGHAQTTEFTDAVIAATKDRLSSGFPV